VGNSQTIDLETRPEKEETKTMPTQLQAKSTIAEIRARFDNDVDRFSQLDTGQRTTIDAPLAMELITNAAIASTSPIRRVLDVGCGAGNNTIKLRISLGCDFAADLLDLSQPMAQRASERVAAVCGGEIRAMVGDFRRVAIASDTYDVVIAAAVLHHLRDEADWLHSFQKLFRILRPGGSMWITDLVSHENDAVQSLMWQHYGEYLTSIGGDGFRRGVVDYIDKEDSPRPVTYQLDLLRRVGFRQVELLHKNSCFAAFGAIKGSQPEH
jgi:tRNA (cmo5U34)-methyltransferase